MTYHSTIVPEGPGLLAFKILKSKISTKSLTFCFLKPLIPTDSFRPIHKIDKLF